MLGSLSKTEKPVPRTFYQDFRVKPGHKLPKEFGDYIRIESDRFNDKDKNIYLIKGPKVRKLNRSAREPRQHVTSEGVIELIYYFSEIGFGAVKPFDQYKLSFKLCLHLSNSDNNACFLFLTDEEDVTSDEDDIYLGKLLLSKPIEKRPKRVKTNSKISMVLKGSYKEVK